MIEPPSDGNSEPRPGALSINELLADLTWEDLTSDGIITIEEIEDSIRAQGLGPRRVRPPLRLTNDHGPSSAPPAPG